MKRWFDDTDEKVITKTEVISSVVVPDGGTVLISPGEKFSVMALAPGKELFLLVKAVVMAEKPKRQVSIECRLMEVGPEFLEKIGIGVKAKKGWWFFKPKKVEKAEGVAEIGDIKEPYYKPEVSYEFFEGDKAMEGKLADDHIRRMEKVNSGGISVYYVDDSVVNNLIQATKKEISRTLAAPKIMVFDGESAMISTGAEMPYVSNYEEVADDEDENVKAITEMLRTGLELELVPLVLKDKGAVDLAVDLRFKKLSKIQEYKNKSGQSYDIPQWEQIRLKTRLPVDEGKTLMITGLKITHGIVHGLFDDDQMPIPARLANMLILVKPTVIERAEATEEAIGNREL